jgi:hypothetical protein
MFVCVGDSVRLEPDERAAIGPAVGAWIEEMEGRGIRLQGDQIAPAAEATTVRVRQGAVVVSAGPFAETEERIAGFNILECADLDQAVEVAAKHPVARFGTLELRPFADG